jgi:hypothetical protein
MTSVQVATGRLSSGAMPGISSLRSFGRRSAARRRRGSLGVPRSSFGARFRTRWPQYGHSVTYGLTGSLQFLQTTKRSGSATDFEGTEAPFPRSRRWR